jgi:hypothetical protein
MAIPIFQLDANRVTKHRRLFPDEIDEDEWVIFHGTSGFNSEPIERDGFDSAHGPISSEHIKRVTTVFEQMKWCGSDMGGYAILKPWSDGYDFQNSNRSRLFFAETSVRALLYATRDFAGGEKLRALRHAFSDLDSFLNDPSISEQHCRSMKVRFDRLSGADFLPSSYIEAARPVDIDLDWLRQKLADLFDVRRIADDALKRHEHGAVYALRMTEDDVRSLHYNNVMGVESRTRISPAKILGKVIVLRDYENDQPGRTAEDLDRLDHGLFVALSTRNGQRKS